MEAPTNEQLAEALNECQIKLDFKTNQLAQTAQRLLSCRMLLEEEYRRHSRSCSVQSNISNLVNGRPFKPCDCNQAATGVDKSDPAL